MRIRVLVLAFAATVLLADTLGQAERDFLLSSLHGSRKTFLDSIAGLSEAQWKFKPAPDRWSIAEVAEHIVLSEDRLFGWEQKTMQSPAVAGRKGDLAADEKLLAGVEDRSQKRKNPPELTPADRFATPTEAAKAFREKRDHTIEYARSTQDDLRTHVATGGPMPLDAYQVLIMLAGHTDRHVAQIKEVKASPGYPAK